MKKKIGIFVFKLYQNITRLKLHRLLFFGVNSLFSTKFYDKNVFRKKKRRISPQRKKEMKTR
jgi:hypothetical protein